MLDGRTFPERRVNELTHEEYRSAIKDVIYLVSCAVNRVSPDAERILAMDISNVYAAAQMHMLTAMAGMMLQSAGIRDHLFDQAVAKAQRKSALLDTDMHAITYQLEQAGIWYMPLKGSVLKDMYPRREMRQMSDVDILIDSERAEDVKDIMEKLEFSCEFFGNGFHDVYHKPPVSNVEIHTALFTTVQDTRLYQYYRNVKERLIKDENSSFGSHFDPDDFYVFMVAHEYKHYSEGGTGLRSLVDTYVYLKHNNLNFGYISAETGKLGIAKFERQNRELAMHLFGSENLTDADQKMLDYILSSGTYGTTEHLVSNQIMKLGGGRRGKLRYLWSRIFIPIESAKGAYPYFYEHKLLLPVLPFYRAWKGLAISPQRLRRELKALISRTKREK